MTGEPPRCVMDVPGWHVEAVGGDCGSLARRGGADRHPMLVGSNMAQARLQASPMTFSAQDETARGATYMYPFYTLKPLKTRFLFILNAVRVERRL